MTRFFARWFPILVVTFASFTSACSSTKEWQGGLIPDSANLSMDAKIAQHTRFVIERVDADAVQIREKDDIARYTVESYKPVLDQIDPTLYRDFERSKPLASWMIIAGGVSGAAVGYASSDAQPENKRYGYVAVAVIAAVAVKIFGSKLEAIQTSIQQTFNTNLEFKLFGPIPKSSTQD